MSAPTVTATGPLGTSTTTVRGDGTTPGGRALRRWRRARWTLLVLALFAIVVLVLALFRPPSSTTPYAPDSAEPSGARAVAQVLERQGVEIHYVTTVADALAAAGPDSPLLVTPTAFMLPEQTEALAGSGADVVLLGATASELDVHTRGNVTRTPAAAAPTTPTPPGCDLPAARAAGDLRLASGLTVADSPAPGQALDVTLCWQGDDGAALAQVQDGSHTVTAVDDPTLIRNDKVLDDGNAALALHLLGTHDDLVWLVQDPLDATTSSDDASTPGGSVLPPWAGPVGLWALLVVVVAIVWRGRRLGALVPEPLPVVVRASEATRGRGRLYRRARSRGHAAAGLRAATADVVARRLGLPRSAEPPALTDAVARATGRHPQEIADLLYGPPPADDEALTTLARRLDTLESEVHRS